MLCVCFNEVEKLLIDCLWKTQVNGRGWRSREAGLRPFYYLGDLWESLKEWSVYGAGVPLIIKETDSVVQYYVPYLSGLQLYVDSSKRPTNNR